MRTCLGCGKEKPKKELLRIVRTPEGNICIDSTGKINGRGTYVCRDPECMKLIQKGHKLGRAFGEQPDNDTYSRILAEFEKETEKDGGGSNG